MDKQDFEKQTITIKGIELTLSAPVSVNYEWIGQTEVLSQVLACWMVVAKEDLPLSPRIVGMPGIGKTTLAMVAAIKRNQPLYIFQCTRPEKSMEFFQNAKYVCAFQSAQFVKKLGVGLAVV